MELDLYVSGRKAVIFHDCKVWAGITINSLLLVCVSVCFVFSVNVAIVTDCLSPVCEAFMLISTD